MNAQAAEPPSAPAIADNSIFLKVGMATSIPMIGQTMDDRSQG
jgi:hypothetical protein